MACEMPGKAGMPSSFLPTGIIYGIVTRQERPASHVPVKLALYAFPLGRFGPPIVRFEGMMLSDAEGRFHFAQLPPLEYGTVWDCYLLKVREGKHTSIRRIHLSNYRPAKEVHLALHASGGISGKVVTPSGAPCACAPVYAVPLPMVEWAEFGPFECLPAFTCANGLFELAGLFPGQWRVEVRAEGYERLLSEPLEVGSRDVHLVLRDGAAISGRVLHNLSGEPVEDVSLQLMDKHGRAARPSISSDESGNYRIQGVPDGTYSIQTVDDVYVRADVSAPIAVLDGENVHDVDIPVAHGAIVTGNVRRLDSRDPIAGIEVVADRGDYHLRRPSPRTKTDHSGNFRFSALPAGSYQIRVCSERDLLGNRIPLHVAPGALNTSIAFALKASQVLSGVVTDREGVPQAGVHLFFVIGYDDTSSAVTDASGRFKVAGGPENKQVRVDVRHCPWRLVSEPVVSELPASLRDLRIIVERGAVVAGTVVSESGELLCEAKVRLISTTNEECSFDTSSEDGGEFSLWGVPEGTYELVAYLGYGLTGLEVEGVFLEVAPGATHTGLKLVLRTPEPDPRLQFTISGCVVNPDGTPIADADVEAFAYNSDSRSCATTHEDGSFSLENLSEEEHEVSAIAINHVGSRRVKAPGGATDVLVVMERYARLRGRVVCGRTGLPVRSFSTVCASEPEVVHILKRHPVQVNSNKGDFDIQVYPGTMYLYVQAGEFAGEVVDLEAVIEGELRDEIVVRLQPEAQVRGTVVDEEGQPVFGACIYFEAISEYRTCLAMTDLDGTFHLRSVGPWLSEIFLSHPDYEEVPMYCVCVPGEITSLNVTLRRPSV